MQFIKPIFYDRFRCTASACQDTCCAGWEVDIDPKTLAYYNKLEGEWGDRLREHMELLPEGGAYFLLDDTERCPFLNDENLCEVMLALGEDALCEICREHPRFYEQIGDHIEMGLGLCCEEAARLLFEQDKPLTFISTRVGDQPAAQEDELRIFQLRDAAYRLVQDRSLPLRVRMHRLIDFGARIQTELFGAPCPSERVSPSAEPPEAREALATVMDALEPYDDTWPDSVRLLDDRSLAVNFDELDGHYENLLVYFLYRHFARGGIDGRLAARVYFCAVSVWFICLMNTKCLRDNGEFTPWDRIACTKDYSKQVEYSLENLEDMLDALNTNPAFTAERLKRLFG